MSKIYGYCRISTKQQSIERQIRNIKAYNENAIILEEAYTGTKVEGRKEFNKLLKKVKEGDTIVATEVSRITRSTKQLCDIIDIAKEKHIKLVLGNFIVDCSKNLDPMTEGMLKMMGVFSELERNMISERIKSGLANARSKGRLVGRPSITIKDIPQKVKDTYKLYKDGLISKTDYAKICNISRPTLDKYIAIIIGN